KASNIRDEGPKRQRSARLQEFSAIQSHSKKRTNYRYAATLIISTFFHLSMVVARITNFRTQRTKRCNFFRSRGSSSSPRKRKKRFKMVPALSARANSLTVSGK